MAPCKLIDHQNGHFSLHIRPLEGGIHHLCVQFNGTHVPGWLAISFYQQLFVEILTGFIYFDNT
jgi:hypothetical protein